MLDNVDFDVREGEILGIVGESGSGKTVTALSLTKLLPAAGRIVGGEVLYRGQNLLALSDKQMNKIRGEQISMVFQNPRASLNPLLPVGVTLEQVLYAHRGLRGEEARRVSFELLADVGLPDPARILRRYPHELSGGMCQRMMIALALSSGPSLLIAHCAALDCEERLPATDRLQRLIGTDLTRLLLVALAGDHRMGSRRVAA